MGWGREGRREEGKGGEGRGGGGEGVGVGREQCKKKGGQFGAGMKRHLVKDFPRPCGVG